MAQTQLAATFYRLRRLAAAARPEERPARPLLADFAQSRDEAAFAALVGRYAPLVLGVCRRALGHHQDAEDAAQATFLVLARGAGKIRRGDSLAAWLHRTAHRVALNAKRQLARRRAREERAARPVLVPPPADLTWREVQAALDEE